MIFREVKLVSGWNSETRTEDEIGWKELFGGIEIWRNCLKTFDGVPILTVTWAANLFRVGGCDRNREFLIPVRLWTYWKLPKKKWKMWYRCSQCSCFLPCYFTIVLFRGKTCIRANQGLFSVLFVPVEDPKYVPFPHHINTCVSPFVGPVSRLVMPSYKPQTSTNGEQETRGPWSYLA